MAVSHETLSDKQKDLRIQLLGRFRVWVAAHEREGLHSLYKSLLIELVRLHEAEGNLARAVETLQRVVVQQSNMPWCKPFTYRIQAWGISFVNEMRGSGGRSWRHRPQWTQRIRILWSHEQAIQVKGIQSKSVVTRQVPGTCPSSASR